MHCFKYRALPASLSPTRVFNPSLISSSNDLNALNSRILAFGICITLHPQSYEAVDFRLKSTDLRHQLVEDWCFSENHVLHRCVILLD